jgi:hypothetical protein
MKTLSQILIDVNSYVDLTAELPTGDDLGVRVNYAQQAVEEWANSYRWRQLKETYTYFATGASLSLPSNFRELLSAPYGDSVFYPEMQLDELGSMDSGDSYSYIRGNTAAGHTLVFNNLPAAGATISFEYQRYPSNMATLSAYCEVPDSEFVKTKVISYTLQSRLDERFPTVEAEAQRLLANMIGREQVITPGGSPSVRRFGSAAWSIGSRFGK